MKTVMRFSTGSKADLEKMINEYFYSENYVITDDNRVYNSKLGKYLDDYIIQEKKPRWSFRKIVGFSTGSKADLEKMINEYFYSENYVITDDNRVYNSKLGKYLDDYIIQEKKPRWSFRKIVG